MIDFELDQFRQNASWRLVLEAYADAQRATDLQKAPHSESATEPGWLPRIQMVDGVNAELLPRIHGKLIALGLLNHELADRNSGVVYRVSPLGAQALSPTPNIDQEAELAECE
jgi:hypothetical protein